MTTLGRFKDAYATTAVAVYEPLSLDWVSKAALVYLADQIVIRTLASPTTTPTDAASNPIGGNTAVAIGPEGQSSDLVSGQSQSATPTMIVAEFTGATSGAASSNGGDAVTKGLTDVFQKLSESSDGLSKLTEAEFRNVIVESVSRGLPAGQEINKDSVPSAGSLSEFLSPIGVMHIYRQLYYNMSEGVGPIEEAFTVAPAETLEVVYETTRRQTHEESMELGSESVSEAAVEEKNLDEVSDKVSSMMQRDTATAMSASATISGSAKFVVYSGDASATATKSTSLTTSSNNSTDRASRRLKDTTKRASERITKSFTIKTRDVLEISTKNSTRRVIANTTDKPVNYGLRRVLRRVNVKVQRLGSRLVWQSYIQSPGLELARSRFVQFLQPGVRPRPSGGTRKDSSSGRVETNLPGTNGGQSVKVLIVLEAEAQLKSARLIAITRVASESSYSGDPAILRGAINFLQDPPGGSTYSAIVRVDPAGAIVVRIHLEYSFEPTAAAIRAWDAESAAAAQAAQAANPDAYARALQDKFEQEKALITERSKIRPRPANDLRTEERYEVMSQIVRSLFGASGLAPQPFQIESFHRFFDIDALFVYNHPSWWVPRISSSGSDPSRTAYEITAESEPAPMGSSLGWIMQLDGDTRRNEFINSPWVRACMPIRPGREEEAVKWLSEHVEGELGFSLAGGRLAQLLGDIAQLQKAESNAGPGGPDYVTADTAVSRPASSKTVEDIFPIVDQYDCVVPTAGFVYDAIIVDTSPGGATSSR